MPTSTVDPQKQQGHKRCDEEKEEQFWGHFYKDSNMTICKLLDICVLLLLRTIQ